MGRNEDSSIPVTHPKQNVFGRLSQRFSGAGQDEAAYEKDKAKLWQMMLYKNYMNAARVQQMDQDDVSLDDDMDERAIKSRKVKFHNHFSKWLTVFIMLLLTMFLSPKFIQREFGSLHFGKYSQLCHRDTDFETKVEDMLKTIADFDNATSLISDAELMDYWGTEMLSSTQVKFSASSSEEGLYTYEGECTKADAEETLSNCDQTECARVRFLFWTVPVQCWTESSCWANQFAALESYDMYANMTSEYNANSLFTTGSTTVSEDVEEHDLDMINVILDQVAWATLALNLYFVLCLIFPKPLLLHRPSLRNSISAIAHLGKFLFVVVAVLVWIGILADRLFPFSDIWAQFKADPCLVDTGYITDGIAKIEAICADIEEMRANFTTLSTSVLDNNADAQLMGACFLPAWMDSGLLADNESYPAEFVWRSSDGADYPQYVMAGANDSLNAEAESRELTWDAATALFQDRSIASCDTAAMREALTDAAALAGSGVDLMDNDKYFAAFLAAAVLAQLLLSVAAVKLAYNAMVMLRPWIQNSGLVDVYSVSEDHALSEEDVREIKRFVRCRRILPLLFWTLMFLIGVAGAGLPWYVDRVSF